MKALGTIHKVCTQRRGEGDLSKSLHSFDVILLFKMLTTGEGRGQIFDLFKLMDVMGGPL